MAIVPSSKLLRMGTILAPLRVQKCLRGTNKNAKRHSSTESSAKLLEHLGERSLIRVAGCESSDFLQGLVTNDMSHFDEGAASIYTLFLNTKGRVMYESIIYKTPEKSTYHVECDARITDDLQRHLKMYRVRRKVDVESMESKMKVWSMFDPRYAAPEANDEDPPSPRQKLEGQIFPCGTLNNKSTKLVDNVAIYEDPRIAGINLRILSDENVAKEEIARRLGLDANADGNRSNYREFRYRLGIGEGIDDLPVGKALPLEVNCDYLHGVSFHKGCYIGQELTARTHHTGVVRKRLMPLIIQGGEEKRLDYDDGLIDESGKVVGKFRGREGPFGLGLMRISEALNAREIFVKDCPVTVTKPRWWPKETQSEKVTADTGK